MYHSNECSASKENRKTSIECFSGESVYAHVKGDFLPILFSVPIK